MTASERARRLLADVIVAAMARDQLTDTTTALLAYVADLEAVAEKALTLNPFSIHTGGEWLDRHIHELAEIQVMAEAALDRPQDGEAWRPGVR